MPPRECPKQEPWQRPAAAYRAVERNPLPRLPTRSGSVRFATFLGALYPRPHHPRQPLFKANDPLLSPPRYVRYRTTLPRRTSHLAPGPFLVLGTLTGDAPRTPVTTADHAPRHHRLLYPSL